MKNQTLIVAAIVALLMGLTSARVEAGTVVGDGWDGPGLGSANVDYYFGTLTTDNGLGAGAIKGAFATAFAAFTAATSGNLTFTEVFAAGGVGSIDIDWFGSVHFGGELAHAYYPAPPNSEPIAGDVHMNDGYSWEIGNGLGIGHYDITLIAAHEIGHSVGLGHSVDPAALMRPSFSASEVFLGLAPDDISTLCSIYACSPAGPGPVPEPSTLFLIGAGLFGVYLGNRRRRAAATV